MLTRPPPAAPPCSDGCGSCHSLEHCASSAQNEHAKDLAARTRGRSRLLTVAPCFSSQSTTSVVRLFASSHRASSAPALTLHRVCGNEGLLTAQRPIDGARAPPLLPCAADAFRFLDASVSDRRSRSLFCKGAARSNPSNRGDPFLASLRAIMGEGGMDTTTRRG